MALTLSSLAIIIMGISGCGKSTLGQRLSEATGYPYVEGDDLHPQENIAKMSAGIALTDEDRWPWLEQVAHVLNDAKVETCSDRVGRIVSCSALRRSYRDFLRANVGDDLLFVYPKVSIGVVQIRLRNRLNHYMPISLLDSQMATLEPPMPDERILTINEDNSPAQSVALIMGYLSVPDVINTHVTPI